MIYGLLSLLLITFGGSGLSKIIFPKKTALDKATCLGALLVILFTFIGGFLGVSFGLLVSVVSITMMGLAIFWIVTLVRERQSVCRDVMQWKSLFWLVPILLSIFIAWYGLARPIHSMSGVELQGLKAKMFLTHDGVGQWFYSEDGWKHLRNHYPTGFAQIVAYASNWMGGYDHYLVRVVPVYFLAVLLLTTFDLTSRVFNHLGASVVVLTLFLSQQFADLALYFYAEPLLMLFGLVGVRLLLLEEARSQVVGCMLMCSMGWIKNEGLVQAAVILGVWTLYTILWDRSYKRACVFPAVGLLAVLPWLLVFKYYGLGDSMFDWGKTVNYMGNWEQHAVSWTLIFKQMFMGREVFGGIWFILSASLVVVIIRFKVHGVLPARFLKLLILYGVTLAVWLVLITLILHCSREPEDHARAMWRLLMLPTVGAMLFGLHNLSSKNDEKNLD